MKHNDELSIDFGDTLFSGILIIPLFLLALPILIIAAILDNVDKE